MRKVWAWLVLAALLMAGCTARKSVDDVAKIALPHAMPDPGVSMAEVVRTEDPLDALASGRVQVALVPGPVPAGYQGFAYRVEEQVLLQGWLDPPLSLTRAEAETKLKQAGRPGVPGPGALARGRLDDLRPGWRAVPVDGVTPTPETIYSGRYPLPGLVSVVYRTAPAHVLQQLEKLSTGTQPPWATLSVAGDFMLARGVARAMREHGTLYPVDRVKEHLARADLAFANLESPIGVKGKALPGKQIWFRAPPEAVEILRAAGLDGVAVANNHILDYDTENFLETLDLLKQAGIKYVGGGSNLAEARQPMVLEARGVRVAFLGYSHLADLFFD